MDNWKTAIFTNATEVEGSKAPQDTPEKERKKLARGKLADFLNEHKIKDFKVLRANDKYIEVAYCL